MAAMPIPLLLGDCFSVTESVLLSVLEYKQSFKKCSPQI